MNKTSFVIGMVIGIIGAFGTGFLKKAGEDLYLLIKSKINPKPANDPPPQLVVHLHENRGESETCYDLPQLAPVTIEHVSRVSFDDIEKTIDNAPPMQRDYIASNYVGLRVEWESYLRTANKRDNGTVYLRLSIDKEYRGRAVLCEIPAEEYPALSILPRGASIRVFGEISKASSCDVELTNVRLQF